MSEHKIISNKDLRLQDIPTDTSNHKELIDFALTFNGCEAAGSREKCVEIGKAHKDATVTDLRICLFYEARKNYWSGGYGPRGYDFDDETALYNNEVLEKIRLKVENGDID
jgi:hypothetical protein